MKNYLNKSQFTITAFPAFKSAVIHDRPHIYSSYEIFDSYYGSKGAVIAATDLNRAEVDYDPFGQPDLIRSFSQIGNDSQVIEWVSKNGFLLSRDNRTAQEDYAFFMEEVKKARQLLTLYNAALRGTEEGDISSKRELKERVQVIKNPSHHPVFGKLDYQFAKYHVLIDGVNTEWWTPGDENRLAKEELSHLALRYATEEALKRIQSVRFSFIGIEDTTSPEFPQRAVPGLECDDLLAMMYLRFYWLITTDLPLRKCRGCGEAYPVVQGEAKRRYCDTCYKDPNHRVNAHRSRIKNK